MNVEPDGQIQRALDESEEEEDDDGEQTPSELIDSVRQLLADPEVGKRIDSLLNVWQKNLEQRVTEQNAVAEAHRKLYTHSLWVRAGLSLVVIASVSILGGMQVIHGEAVVGILAAFSGYLWGERNSRTSSG